MMSHQLNEEEGILFVRPGEKMQSAEFDSIDSELDNYFERNHSLKGVILDFQDLPGWERTDLALNNFSFARKHGKKIKKMALICANPSFSAEAQAIDPVLEAQVKVFDSCDVEAAREWVEKS